MADQTELTSTPELDDVDAVYTGEFPERALREAQRRREEISLSQGDKAAPAKLNAYRQRLDP